MKKYSDTQILKKVIEIIKKYNKTSEYFLVEIKNQVSAKYEIPLYFWLQILTTRYRPLLNRILNYITLNKRMMKTLNYYFANMNKPKKDGTGNEIKERAILDFFAYSYRILVPVLRKLIVYNMKKKKLNRKKKKKK